MTLPIRFRNPLGRLATALLFALPLLAARASAPAVAGFPEIPSASARFSSRDVPLRQDLRLEPFATAPGSVTAITHAGDDRLFVSLRDGRVVVFDDGGFRSQPFLDIRGMVSQVGEGGLLSTAFHPRYGQHGLFFVNYTDTAGDTVIARYQVSGDPNRADPASRRVLLTIDQPFANHNGGQLQFGPDGYLYIGMGDGGGAFDPQCNGQREDSLLGKMLRLDVDQSAGSSPFYGIPADNPFRGPGGMLDEVWASGLRNPWRFTFDRETGDLWIADVGQNSIEEVDFQPAGSRGGQNYGWRLMEGTQCLGRGSCPASTPGCGSAAFTAPVVEYDHSGGECSVNGGYVYRGDALPGLRGTYLFGDFCSGTVWTYRRDSGAVHRLGDRVSRLVTFGEDRRGEIYAASLDGAIFRLTGEAGPPPPPPASPDGVGVYDPRAARFHLKDRLVTGPADRSVRFGRPRSPWIPVAGDWNGDGVDTIGFYDPAGGLFRLKNSLTGGNADILFPLSLPTPSPGNAVPLVGDWDGDGRDTVGLFDRASGVFHLKDSLNEPGFDRTFSFDVLPPGRPYLPLAGDWDGDGEDTVGLYDPTAALFRLAASHDSAATVQFQFGTTSRRWLPIAGDWDGDGRDGIGLYDPANGNFRLRNGLSTGAADLSFRLRPRIANGVPLAGDW